MPKECQQKKSYEVQAILDSKKRSNGEKLYLIKWKSYSSANNTWEPIQHLIAVEELVRAFEIQQFQLAMKNIKKIKRRFEAQKNKYLQKEMLQTFNLQKSAINNQKKPAKRRGIIFKRPYKPRPRLNKRKPITYEKIQLIQKIVQKQQINIIEPKVQISNNELVHELSNVTELKQTRQTGFSTRSRREKLYSSLQKIQMQAEDCQKQESQQMEDEYIQQQNIQDIFRKSKKVESTTLTYEKNTFFFHITFRNQGETKQLKISKQQVFKINPQWINNFFLGFQY